MNLYATFPSSWSMGASTFRKRAATVAEWVDNSDCRGLLVYTDHRVIDPWVAAQYLIERTDKLVPLVAAQPAYTHPFAVARLVSSLACVYGRRVDLNLVTGGNRNDVRAIGGIIDHDARYDQLVEYATIVEALLATEQPWSYHGRYYHLDNALLQPALEPSLRPERFVAGSSGACVEAARTLGAVRLTYPLAVEAYSPDASPLRNTGVRFGVIARDTTEAAWAVAQRRFPPDPKGERLRDLTVRTHPGTGVRRMLDDARDQQATHEPRPTYWLYPYRSFKEYCPYLVGSHEEVGHLLARYFELGVNTLIMAMPWEEDDVHHALAAVRRAESMSLATGAAGAVGDR